MTTSSSSSSSASSSSSSSQSSTTSSSSNTVTTTSQAAAPTTFTYETDAAAEYLDPSIAYFQQDFYYLQNEYENLLMYNKSTTQVLPWLASNYTVSSNLEEINFTLRQGITFDDGEPVNSSAVYFSLNRLLIFDGSTPTTHGTQAAWILQQLLNTSLSSNLCGCAQTYNTQWVNEVLGQNFVQITGPYTFTLHVMHPTSSFPQMIEFNWGEIMAPEFVMQHDVALWNQSSAGYSLPYDSLSGNLSTQMNEYFDDVAATCNAGTTSKGCGTTFLDCAVSCSTPSLAGSGPYEIESVDSAGDIVMKANPSYWGGPYQYMGGQKIVPYFTTIDVKYVTDPTTREIDLENGARAGQAMTIDELPINMYDLVNRNDWLNNNTLQSIYPDISVYGPFSQFEVNWFSFDMNVTNQNTGDYYQFQPFADIRFRQAFADSVNISEINIDENNNLGIVANSVIPPNLPPNGAYNSSTPVYYNYNLTAVQDLLVAAMENPITHFNFENGTAAPQGFFNNTFGCTAADLSANSGMCAHPVQQSIDVEYQSGDVFDETILTSVAEAINNVSSTYNMGLTVSVVPIPTAEYFTEAYTGYFYCYWGGYIADYPWSTDLLSVSYAPGHAYPAPDGWNFSTFGDLYQQVLTADATGNMTGNVAVTNAMNNFANQEVMYLYTVYPEAIAVFTSNVQGVYFNPFLLYPYYFAYLS
jgi:ABC-type transport system substrate-binding protein